MKLSRANQVLVLVGLARLLDFTVRLSIVPFFPDLAVRYGVSYAAIGSLFAAFFVGAATFQVPFGWASDRYPPQRLAALGAVTLCIAGLVFARTDHLAVAIAARFLTGAGISAMAVAGVKLVSDAFPSSRRGRALSILEVVIGTSMLLALTVFPLLTHRVTLQSILTALALGNLPLAFFMMRLPDLRRQKPAASADSPLTSGTGRKEFIRHYSRQTLAILTLSFSGIMVMNAYQGWLPTFLEEVQQFTKDEAALVMAIIMLSHIPAAYISGWLTDRLGRLPVVNLSSILLLPPLLALAWLQQVEAGLTTIAPIAIMLGIGGGFTPAPVIAFSTEALGPARAGFGTSLMQLAAHLGGGAAGVVFGAIVDMTGSFAWGWLLMAAFLVARLFMSRLAVEPAHHEALLPRRA